MFSNMNLSDRLKAAVKEIETQGTALQQRALHAANTNKDGQASKTGTSANTTGGKASSEAEGSVLAGKDGAGSADGNQSDHPPSPTHFISPTGLADTALSGLSGLRRSFNFRSSVDGNRPTANDLASAAAGSKGPQELKDLPTSPPPAGGSTTSRPSSPGNFLQPMANAIPAFSLGGTSEQSSISNTPLPRSPGPTGLPSSSLAKSPILAPSPHIDTQKTANLPPPNPSDPATYPLPPSPPLSALLIPTPTFGDPLGASPRISPIDGVSGGTTVELPDSAVGNSADGMGLGIGAVDMKAPENVETIQDIQENGVSSELGLEAIQKLGDAEKRFEELNLRYSKVLKEHEAASKIIQELTPLDGGLADPEALEGWVRMMKGKVDMITEEMKRLQDKITLQDSRMEEVRDTHRLEGTSQTEMIAKLRTQLSTAETNLATKATELVALGQLRADLAKAQTTAKEEEEKRTKAISLLKTVRMKLVKMEKEKEEVEKDRAEERAERSRAGEEVERVKAEKEREVNALRKGFEREMTAAREKFEKDMKERKAAWELEMITTKAAHAKEASNKLTKISGLESIVKELSTSKADLFETLQSRQEEVESSRTETEALRTRTNELEFQLREANDRVAMLEENSGMTSRPNGLNDRGRATLGVGHPDGRVSPSPSRNGSFTNAGELQRLLAEAESRSEAKLADLRFKVRSLEKERNESEEEWAAKLQERVHETEKLRRIIHEKEGEYAESLRKREERDTQIGEQEQVRKMLEKEIQNLKARLEETKEDIAAASDGERLAKDELSSLRLQVSNLTLSLEDTKTQYNTLRTTNRTLRDELRKVQSSVQLMERSRNPGVGYWSAGAQGPGSSASASGTNMTNGNKSGEQTPMKDRTSEYRKSMESVATTSKESVASEKKEENKDEEEVNLEYLRNVILQFLENKEMRPNLVRVLSVILRFTPQELRRLNAKLLT